MARTRATSRLVEAVHATGKKAVAGPPVEMKFKNLRRIGGSDVAFDLEVRAGDATDVAIVSPFMPDNPLFEHDILASATCQMRGVRVSTLRPMFVFSGNSGITASVQVDLSSGRPRVMGEPVGNVYVR